MGGSREGGRDEDCHEGVNTQMHASNAGAKMQISSGKRVMGEKKSP